MTNIAKKKKGASKSKKKERFILKQKNQRRKKIKNGRDGPGKGDEEGGEHNLRA